MLLDSIGAPDDVKRIAAADVSELCREVRSRIVEVTLKNGGHMASSLGAVELITALLRVFDPSSDRVVFDVGPHNGLYSHNSEQDMMKGIPISHRLRPSYVPFLPFSS